MTKCAHVLSLMRHTFGLKISLKRTFRGNVQRLQMNSVKYACIFRGKFNLCPSLKRMVFLGRSKWYYHIKDTFNGTSNGICHCFEVHTKAQFDRRAPLNFLTKGDNKQLLIHFLFIFLLRTMRCNFTTFSVISGASCTFHIPVTGSNSTAQVITITMKMAI